VLIDHANSCASGNRASHKLTRLLEWAGFDRGKFDIISTEGEIDANQRELLRRNRVVVPMGNVPLAALTGREGVLSVRGYIQGGQGELAGLHILPTVHPTFIQRGQSKYSAAFIHDVQKAVELAERGYQFESTSYILDPLPSVAYEWARTYVDNLRRHNVDESLYLAYDIETPYKGDDEGDLDPDADSSYFIQRIGFCYEAGRALSIPWEGPYLPAIKLLMESEGEKVVWNGGFDNPRIRHNGVNIHGLVHDGMVAWHVLHSDLPKGLGFVATFTCPYQPAWKHLSHARPAFYNATDADVELRSMLAIESELRRTGLWDVYQRDVVDLDPILRFMSEAGMPVDATIRAGNAAILDEKLRFIKGELEGLVPLAARKVEHVYKKPPVTTTGLFTRPATVVVKRCDRCGVANPRADHFKVFKKKSNPCGGAERCLVDEPGVEWYRLAQFKPSREQIIRYQQHFNRTVPMTRDKKSGQMRPTTDEKAMKTLILKYPHDPLYNLILEYRELDKLAGTYVGRPVGDIPCSS
jgi:hypothetical protein